MVIDPGTSGFVKEIASPDRLHGWRGEATKAIAGPIGVLGVGDQWKTALRQWAETTTRAVKMIMTVFVGIAKFERDLIRERTGAGREAAKQRGVRFGQPRKLNTDQAQVAAQLLAEGQRSALTGYASR